jgi:uncharacterized protein YjcR
MTTRTKFKKLWAVGLTFADIAKALNVSSRSLFKWRSELNLPRRTRGRRKL